MSRPDPLPVIEFLQVRSPKAWCVAASQQLDLLLVDHANCEKKAASTAIGLTYRYVQHTQLLHTMSRLAREELRHFEQVLDLMSARQVAYVQLSASRYAGELHKHVRQGEPARLVDTLVLGAVVEARSCERFVALQSHLPSDVAQLYEALVNSEARHYQDYLSLAQSFAGDEEIAERVQVFLQADAQLISSTDDELRFHSGVPG